MTETVSSNVLHCSGCGRVTTHRMVEIPPYVPTGGHTLVAGPRDWHCAVCGRMRVR
jgi:hypothetical protein